MKIKKIILLMIWLMSLIASNTEKDLEKYIKLETKNVASIRKSDLPHEFSDRAFEVVDEFIKKTSDLNYEILLFFDYITGEILRCKIGSDTSVKLHFKDYEFDGKHVASIHNHTKNMYSPSSYKNFGIFIRKWEDYELIAGYNELWILKAKIEDKKLFLELKLNSKIFFDMVADYYSKRCKNNHVKIENIDNDYGELILKYINDKNKKEIQLQKKEYKYDN